MANNLILLFKIPGGYNNAVVYTLLKKSWVFGGVNLVHVDWLSRESRQKGDGRKVMDTELRAFLTECYM